MAQPKPSASSSPPSAAQDDEPSPPPYYGTPAILHNVALLSAVAGPIGLLLPGRSRSASMLQNILLGGGTFFGINQLAHDYTGKSVLQRSNERWAKVLTPLDPLPEKARANRALIEAERARRAASLPPDERAAAEAEIRRREQAKAKAERGLLARLWMGGEEEDWKDRRREEDQKALENGKGIGDIIMDQVREAWSQVSGKKEGGEAGAAAEPEPRKDGPASGQKKEP